MKGKSLLTLLILIPLVSCSTNSEPLTRTVPCFNTYNYLTLYEETKADLNIIEQNFSYYDKLTDNYLERDVTNIYKINKTNKDVKVDEYLYNLLQLSMDLSEELPLFNPLCGGLAKKWKEALKNSQILDEMTISSELEKIKTSTILFKENNTIQRVGEAQIDLGAITKGFVIDNASVYLASYSCTKYLINAGYSSILLGEKPSDDGYFNVGISSLNDGSYLRLKNCILSTSGVSEQGKEINGVTYSHIVNPITGSAINNYESVRVVSNLGYLGDVLSTVMMMSSIDEIKALETKYRVKALAIKDKQIVYRNSELEVLKH